jgi:glycolate oxidase FAD binding subunit
MTTDDPGIAAALRAAVGPEHVVAGDAAEGYRLGRAAPALGVRPGCEAEVSAVLSAASRSGLAVVPWGGGLHQALAARPRRYDLALDLTRLDRILEHEPADLTVTVQAGIRLGALQERLGAAAQLLGLDPPLADRATLGGVLAANLSGPLRCRYGTARDLVLGVRVAHADGTVTRAGAKVVKNATAYDVTKLYLGSHGTLGVILEATLRLFPRPQGEAGWWVATGDLDAAQAVADRVLGGRFSPTRVELVEAGAAAALDLRPGGPGVLVSCGGVAEALLAQAAALARLAEPSGGRLHALDPAAWARLRDFPWARGEGRGAERASWRASVLPAACAKALHGILDAGGHAAGTAAVATVSHGAIRGQMRDESAGALAGRLQAAREAVARLGGFLVMLDAPESVRDRVDVWGAEPAGFAVMQKLKQAFDPRGTLNPGRFVGSI